MPDRSLYTDRRLILLAVLGFASGLPLALTASTLSAWLSEAGISKSAIGLFAAVATPYTFKFLWAPLVDGIRIPLLCRLLGKRRGWLLATQCILICAIFGLGLANPEINPWVTALLAVIVASLSATQDIIIDAYRVEILPEDMQGAGAATLVFGYRIGMVVSSAGALYLAAHVSWQLTYACMAAILGIGILATLIAREPQHFAISSSANGEHEPKMRMGDWLNTYVVQPFQEFSSRKGWWFILLFIMVYRLSDAFLGIMTMPFLLETGYSKEEIAGIVKLFGLIATLGGTFFGGWLASRYPLIAGLWLCGILSAITNLTFLWPYYTGPETLPLAAVITMENFAGGLTTAFFVAYLSLLCNARFTATQYALLSALAAVGRTWLSTPAGAIAETLNWEIFFFISAALAIPGLVMLRWLARIPSKTEPHTG